MTPNQIVSELRMREWKPGEISQRRRQRMIPIAITGGYIGPKKTGAVALIRWART
jgi:hypothetical protein